MQNSCPISHNSGLRKFAASPSTPAVTRAEHLYRLHHLSTWLTPERRILISGPGVDRLANSPTPVAFSRFLAGAKSVTFRISGLDRYYPVLAHLGYTPPTPEEVIEALGSI
jgi:hypothetical protein